MAKYSDPQVAAQLAAARAFQTIDVPTEDGEELRVAVRLLSDAEIDACRQQAQVTIRTWAKGRGFDANAVVDFDPDMLERALQRQMVWSAFYDIETIAKEKPERFFPTYDDVARLAAVTTQSLWEAYLEHQSRVIARRNVTTERVKEIAETVIAGDVMPSLGGLDRQGLIAFVQELAAVIRRERKAS